MTKSHIAPTLTGTEHAYDRWRARAPRGFRSRASFRAALRAARPTGHTLGARTIYRAFGMALVVANGRVVTCWPWARTPWGRQEARRAALDRAR